MEFPITDRHIIGEGKREQTLQADYVLEYSNKRLTIIKAEARNLLYTASVGQAKNDAEHLNIRYAYASNRLKIYGVHMDEGAEGDVDRIPTPG